MIDFIDKKQQQQPAQQLGREPPFWAPASNHHHNNLHQATSNSVSSQALKQTKPSHQILIDVQPDEAQIQQANNELIGYYFGSISRETAEWILLNHGQQLDGAYLLRSSGPKDDFVLSLLVVHELDSQLARNAAYSTPSLAPAANLVPATSQNALTNAFEVLHYKIVETEDSFVALHGQVGDEKFATIDELIERAQGVATKPKWPIQRHSLESQILPPTFWGLTVDQIRLAILIKAKQWGFPLSMFQQPIQNGYESQSSVLTAEMNGGMPAGCPLQEHQQQSVNTLNNETIRTLIYKSLHEFQPWFHGSIGRDEAERRIEENCQRDGRFLVRERDNFSYAMCISHKRTTKHYRIDVLSTGELAIQDGRKFTSLMALVSHYTIMSDGLWCALTEACPRPIQQPLVVSTMLKPAAAAALNIQNGQKRLPAPETSHSANCRNQAIYCTTPATRVDEVTRDKQKSSSGGPALMCPNQSAAVLSIKAPIKEWLLTINNKWSQMLAGSKQSNGQPNQSLNSFLFGSSNPLNNHCRHKNHNHHHHHHHNQRRGSKAARQTNQSQSSSHKSTTRQHKSSTIAKQLSNGSCQCCPPIERTLGNRQIQKGPVQVSQLSASMGATMGAGQCRTKALISSLPQSAGFMLDGQSFIGSPLFAVRPTNQLHSNMLNGMAFSGGACPTVSIGPNGASNGFRVASTNVNGANTFEKLISPAQSMKTGLNQVVAPDDSQMNPYALNTDFYGSQTSTAIVNDRLRTNSSSSSSSHRQNNHTSHQIKRASLISSADNHASSQKPSQANGPVGYDAAYGQRPPVRVGLGQVQSVAGQIVCGQHAGPAYRYTNCTGNQANLELNQCVHSTRGLDTDWNQQQARAADDLQLLGPTSGSQLMGPAALTKFVQFQDGKCLRTHRDTKSIQMAYLLSRQEALNVLNGRQQAAASRRLQPSALDNNRMQHGPFGSARWQNDKVPSSDDSIRQTNNAINQQADSIEYDLIDCDGDGSGFQFKYDPKLIKSSSIETLCGIVDEREDDLGSHTVDLNAFKSNSELLMSLNPLWSQAVPVTTGSELYPSQNPLLPMTASLMNGDCKSNGGDCLSLLMQLESDCVEDGREESREPNTTNDVNGSRLEETWNKKHNLDELTTSLLAELTASLKAQVDLKNKRSGLCSIDSANEQCGEVQSEPERTSQSQQQVETNPMDLIEEFDTLIRDKR